jgi:hypothetical protein
MKVAKVIDLFLEYHRLNSQKKIQAVLMNPCYQSFATNILTESRSQFHQKKFFHF